MSLMDVLWTEGDRDPRELYLALGPDGAGDDDDAEMVRMAVGDGERELGDAVPAAEEVICCQLLGLTPWLSSDISPAER